MLSNSLNKRFVKDMKLPITLFSEPYFSERLEAIDPIYHCVELYKLFEKEISTFSNPDDYFAEYNRVKDEAINAIKGSEGWIRFNQLDMKDFQPIKFDYRSNDIYTDMYRNKFFISIDMRKANFSVLHQYDANIFGGADTWEEFISKYTSFRTIIGSKYIRQVILGNCNPKRVISYEKYLMSHITKEFIECISCPVVFFSNDELIFQVEEEFYNQFEMFTALVDAISKKYNIPLKVEFFKLLQLTQKLGYIKEVYTQDGGKSPVFKCLDSDFAHIIIKQQRGQAITDNDRCVYFKGFVAELKEIPEFGIVAD